jgi:hypothetical protein
MTAGLPGFRSQFRVLVIPYLGSSKNPVHLLYVRRLLTEFTALPDQSFSLNNELEFDLAGDRRREHGDKYCLEAGVELGLDGYGRPDVERMQ